MRCQTFQRAPGSPFLQAAYMFFKVAGSPFRGPLTRPLAARWVRGEETPGPTAYAVEDVSSRSCCRLFAALLTVAPLLLYAVYTVQTLREDVSALRDELHALKGDKYSWPAGSAENHFAHLKSRIVSGPQLKSGVEDGSGGLTDATPDGRGRVGERQQTNGSNNFLLKLLRRHRRSLQRGKRNKKSTLLSVHFEGSSGSLSSPIDGKFTHWKYSAWVRRQSKKSFKLKVDGDVQVKKGGVYLFYSQITFKGAPNYRYELHQVGGSENPLALCMLSLDHQHYDIQDDSKMASCSIAKLIYLKKNSKLFLKQFPANSLSNMKSSASYFGLIKL